MEKKNHKTKISFYILEDLFVWWKKQVLVRLKNASIYLIHVWGSMWEGSDRGPPLESQSGGGKDVMLSRRETLDDQHSRQSQVFSPPPTTGVVFAMIAR